MVLVYFRGHGNWYMADETGISKQENKIEHRVMSTDNPRLSAPDFYRPADVVDGIFRLTDSDDQIHQITGTIDKEKISRLSPCLHSQSAFQKLVDAGRLPAEIFDQCYFEIRRNRLSESFLRRHPERNELGKLEWYLEFPKLSDQSGADTDPLEGSPPPDFLNPKHQLHSSELRIAYEVWNAVLKGIPEKPKCGSRKKLVDDWLRANYPQSSDLSGEARKRIATLVNSDVDKNGGAPSTF